MATKKKAPSRLAARAILVLLAAVVGVILWRAFGARGVGVFPLLADVPVMAIRAAASGTGTATKLRPQLAQKRDAAKAAGTPLTFCVDLVAQVDIDRFGKLLDDRGLRERKQERRRPFLDAFRLVADEAERPLLARLDALKAAGRVTRYDPFHIVARVAVVAKDAGVVDELAAMAEVAALIEDVAPSKSTWVVPAATNGSGPSPAVPDAGAHAAADAGGGALSTPPPNGPPAPPPGKANPISWAIDAVHAPSAWARGLDGRGVVVGLLDTGADARHEQLSAGYRGAIDPERAADSSYDPRGSQTPVDTQPHGTGVLAAAVGRNVPTRDGAPVQIGVAPGATWVSAVAYPEGAYNHVFLTAAADWMLFRAQPDVVIHTVTSTEENADPLDRQIFSAFKAAEMVVVFAAGNHGPKPAHNHQPANIVNLYPFSDPTLSVGSVDRAGRVSDFSARGPSALNFSELFPRLVAPGEDVTVAVSLSPDALIRAHGTSYAAGTVAGTAAILIQAAPNARPNVIEGYLSRTADRGGSPMPDNSRGWGILDVAAALRAVDADQRRVLDGGAYQ